MEIEVYDTYARSEEGLKIHFDVMLPIGGDEATAQDKAREFIEKISETANPVQLESCRFCHTETAKPDVGERVEHELESGTKIRFFAFQGFCFHLFDPLMNVEENQFWGSG